MALDEETFKDLKHAQQLSGSSDIAKTIKAALAVYLDKKDSLRKLTKKPKIKSVREKSRAQRSLSKRKYIPVAVKRKIIECHGVRCAHVDLHSGRRCTETRRLEFDHRWPHAAGGGNEWKNLRPLCRAHNLLAARKFFGAEKIRAEIAIKQGRGQKTIA